MYAIKEPSLRINQADLKCKNGCGFYGNADWKGYCSKCYRNQMELERLQKKKSQHSPENISIAKKDNAVNQLQHQSMMPGFTKFEEKKRQQTDKKSSRYFKNLHGLLKGSTSTAVKECGGKLSSNSEIIRHYQQQINKSDDNDKLLRDYEMNYGPLGDNLRNDFFTCTQSFIKQILNESFDKPIEDLAETAQKYYNWYSSRINSHVIYREVHSKVKLALEDFYEKFCMINLYSLLFCPTITNDEEKDLSIQDRIRKLTWVNAQHLDCCINETSVELRDLVYTAITDLNIIDSMKAPQEKLECAVKCCRSVVDILKHCQGGPVSADEFLPALIFVVLKANPVRLKSNILYVTRFCNDSKLMQGEAGYYFTNLCCAVSFIENITAESLNMSKHEFLAYMSGEVKTVSAWESALVACEGMHQLYEHISILNSLKAKMSLIQQQRTELMGEIKDFGDEIKEEISRLLDQAPVLIKEKKKQKNEMQKNYDNCIISRPLKVRTAYDSATSSSSVACPVYCDTNELFKVNYGINYFVENHVDNFNNDGVFVVPPKPLEEEQAEMTILENDFPRSYSPKLIDDNGPISTRDIDNGPVNFESQLSPTEFKPEYTGFSKQGSKIPNIPCSTGDNSK